MSAMASENLGAEKSFAQGLPPRMRHTQAIQRSCMPLKVSEDRMASPALATHHWLSLRQIEGWEDTDYTVLAVVALKSLLGSRRNFFPTLDVFLNKYFLTVD